MGKKGGSTTQTTTVKLPPEIEAAAKANMKIADSVASLGATPFNGPSIAGFSPQQIASMQATDQAASAFGMPSAVNWQQGRGGAMSAPKGMSNDALFTALTGMPPPNASAGGFTGYNTQPIAQAAYDKLPPAQRALIESFTMNPVTGAAATNTSVPKPEYNVQQALQGKPQGNRAVTPAPAKAISEALKRLREERMYGGNR